ncbi:hypothetical protein MUN82_07045 [Hymenobacter aerilatus]|uniref:Uncharacterized protein n=1 Tax=Hymenobacter aerilatus TaxID=2932251 RepID=A0A8T9SZP3_9BACT|nr:hypothetical protein [Hymenobacter aerilatus]UOR06851.1 hypothetical protein MUN82_07045 [Hymenobacter aerilatus]
MQPEDIDQLFRDRLQGHAPTPPDHLWAQLEEEIQPAKKRPAMWLYSAAAVVALLLAVGLGWLLQAPGTVDTAGQLATTSPAASAPKKELPTQATAPQDLASIPSEAPVATAPDASTAQTALPASSQPAATHMVAATTTSARPAPAAVATLATPKARPERLGAVAASEVATVAVPATLTTTQVPTRPIEVEVVREAAAPVLVASSAPAATPQQRSRLGAVLRQARNAVVGDPVDLQQVGLPETLTVQARVAGHQLNKTIQL